MEEEDTKQCPNCKREIPSINFTTHSVHCARNLKNCPVCKEPVPVAQLQEHHDALHKEVPCKKCGESVCGTDLEDHIRDSCSHTIQPCRYCELELPRHSLPAHETYCGARSEQCPDCKEYVMIKYRQLHLESNHGFIRLLDDPIPMEIKAKPKPLINGSANPSTSRQNGPTRPDVANRPQTGIRPFSGPSNVDRALNGYAGVANSSKNDDNRASSSSAYPGVSTSSSNVDNRFASSSNNFDSVGSSSDGVERNGKVTAKRTNDQPQINTSVEPKEKVQKDLPSRGAVKKRPAPQPPQPPADPRRDLPFWSAQKRAQDEERKRRELTAYNLSVGLPPVLSAAEKLDKLRKMDALHNREVEEDYSHKLRGRVWQPVEPDGQRLGGPDAPDLSHLRPMSAQQFMDRFHELQLGAAAAERGGATSPAPSPTSPPPRSAAASGDRFSEIKSSLRELRRGLNEVTAPYNTAPNPTNSTQIDSNRLPSPSPPSPPAAPDDDGELRLPCEFCGVPILADDLVLHQTGCRPDLTQYRPKKPSRAPRVPRPKTVAEMERLDDPVIPCEFCTESLPVYLISEHQVSRVPCCVKPSRAPRVPRPKTVAKMERVDDPVIPCEFCTESLPVYLISEHQVSRVPCCVKPSRAPRVPRPKTVAKMERVDDPVIPCEFCTESLPVYLISEHQVSRVPCCVKPSRAPRVPRPKTVAEMERVDDPVIPCEFCTESLPVYLISEHQVSRVPCCVKPSRAPRVPRPKTVAEMERVDDPVIPCEFSTESLPVYLISEHQVSRVPCCVKPSRAPRVPRPKTVAEMERVDDPVIPCEFCTESLPVYLISEHQVSRVPCCVKPSRAPRVPRPKTVAEMERVDDPVIPCEFCTESLPVYLISEHQVSRVPCCVKPSRAPRVPRPKTVAEMERLDDPVIPCEFCTESLPVYLISEHQVSRVPCCVKPSRAPRVPRPKTVAEMERVDDPVIPCEFCTESLPVYLISEHQVSRVPCCVKPSRAPRVPRPKTVAEMERLDDPVIPCEFCTESLPVYLISEHQVSRVPCCVKPSRAPRVPRPKTVAEMERVDDPVIPCEFCTESLPVYLISEHQVSRVPCCVKPSRAPRVPRPKTVAEMERVDDPVIPCEFCTEWLPVYLISEHQVSRVPCCVKPSRAPRVPRPKTVAEMERVDDPVIPCEFCTESLPVYLISEHQVSRVPCCVKPSRAPRVPRPKTVAEMERVDDPVIPCEFCTESLPVYLISEHQVSRVPCCVKPSRAPRVPRPKTVAEMERVDDPVIPCEFCTESLPVYLISEHQVSRVPCCVKPSRAPRVPRPKTVAEMERVDDPVIPCEFCTESLPVYLISEHQVSRVPCCVKPSRAPRVPRPKTVAEMERVDDPVIPCEFCTESLPVYLISEHQVSRVPCCVKPSRAPRVPRPKTVAEMERLDDPVIPCEFCTESLPVYLISEHQVSRVPCCVKPSRAPRVPRPKTVAEMERVDDPVIPCEFCTESLPVYLISEHQVSRVPCCVKPSRAPRVPRPKTVAEMERVDDPVIPCEFCTESLPVYLISEHQVSRVPCCVKPSRAPRVPRPKTVAEMERLDDPVIPCEFCTESLPVYLISEHQERCRRDANVLYPD